MLKGTHDLALKAPDGWSALGRVYWFHDFRSDQTQRTDLTDSSVTAKATLLDAWIAKEVRYGDQRGKIKVMVNGVMQATPFLDVGAQLTGSDAYVLEYGLLGLVFDPGDAAESERLVNALLTMWRAPGHMIESVYQYQPGVWVHETARIDDGARLIAPAWIGDERVRVVAAAVPRAQIVSGWDFAAGGPKASRRMAAAGSVYWVELPADLDAAAWLAKVWMKCIPNPKNPQDSRDGFGLCAVGVG